MPLGSTWQISPNANQARPVGADMQSTVSCWEISNPWSSRQKEPDRQMPWPGKMQNKSRTTPWSPYITCGDPRLVFCDVHESTVRMADAETRPRRTEYVKFLIVLLALSCIQFMRFWHILTCSLTCCLCQVAGFGNCSSKGSMRVITNNPAASCETIHLLESDRGPLNLAMTSATGCLLCPNVFLNNIKPCAFNCSRQGTWQYGHKICNICSLVPHGHSK